MDEENRNQVIQKINTGSKFYRFEDGSDEPIIIRVIHSSPDRGNCRCKLPDGRKVFIDNEKLLSDYTMLKPDGLVTVSVVSVEHTKDVIVTFSKMPLLGNLPEVVCRQYAFDLFANTDFNRDIFYAGICVTQKTCPANIKFEDMLRCDGVIKSIGLAIYLDDGLDDIIGLFRQEEYDNILKDLKKMAYNNPPVMHINVPPYNLKINAGFHSSLRELLMINGFMSEIRNTLGIYEFPIALGGFDELTYLNREFLEQALNHKVGRTYVTPYDKSIDLREITKDYVLGTSLYENQANNNTVYIIGYDKLSE